MSSEREKFAQRLNEGLDDMNYPPMGHGRQSALAKELELSPHVVGCWLKGEDFPKTSHLVKVSQFLDVRSNWLLSGVGSKYPRQGDQMEHAVRKRQEDFARSGPRLDKEAFEIALAWMKLPVQQRVVLKKVITELCVEQHSNDTEETKETD